MARLILILSILFFITSSAKHTYTFQLYVSTQIAFPADTDDPIWFRLCNSNWNCGIFTEWAGGLDRGLTYNFNYSTNQYLGPIAYSQIIHKGSDAVCFGHIKVDGIEYDDGTTPDCLDGNGEGCQILTVTLSTNDWVHSNAIPCTYENILYDTYEPTPQPTDPSRAPTIPPSTNPTDNPTNQPTILPSSDPTIGPTLEPTSVPTIEPSSNPTGNPTIDPTILPSPDPTIGPSPDPTMEPSLTSTLIGTTQPPAIDPTMIQGIPMNLIYPCTQSLLLH